jgi:DNA polymerase-1
MQTFRRTLDGSECTVNVVETDDDRRKFEEWLSAQRLVAVDTETTGLDIYAPAFRCLMVQFGNGTDAWVLHVNRWRAMIQKALLTPNYLIMHNAPYDWLVIDRHVGFSLEKMADRTFDTRILAHLLDPRTESEGGLGHSLKRLAEVWVDSTAPDGGAALKERFRELKATVDTGWAVIDENDPVLLEYAGIDVLLTFRVFEVLRDMCKQNGFDNLVTFEHHLQGIVAGMQRKGMLLDVDYTRDLKSRLGVEAAEQSKIAARYGVSSINSTAQVAAALTAMGEELTEFTPSGAPKVDKAVLLALADLDRDWKPIGGRTPNPLADSILRAKRAEKWGTAYADAFLELMDTEHRIHPFIGTLQARTARMSVSRPPLQQLPSSDWMVRRCFIADPGHVIGSVDYDQIEMRMVAALSGDKAMTEAILAGVDMHSFTAEKVFGPDFTPKQRKIAKGIGFAKVYGGGAVTTARQTGADIESVKQSIAAYNKTFHGLTRYSASLQRSAEFGKKEIVTPTGRHLPLDRDRLYSATNYMIQSSARDVLAQSIVNLHEANLTQYVLLPIHDELLLNLPVENAVEIGKAIDEVMTTDFMGIPLTASADIFGPTWAHGYGYEEINV